jgi:hypothetical protein
VQAGALPTRAWSGEEGEPSSSSRFSFPILRLAKLVGVAVGFPAEPEPPLAMGNHAESRAAKIAP